MSIKEQNIKVECVVCREPNNKPKNRCSFWAGGAIQMTVAVTIELKRMQLEW